MGDIGLGGTMERTGTLLGRPTIAALAMTGALLVGASAIHAQDGDGGGDGASSGETVVLEVVEVALDDDGIVIDVAGKADVPDGLQLSVGLEFGERAGRMTRAIVKGKRFTAKIEAKDTIVVPGKYILRAGASTRQHPRIMKSVDRATLQKLVASPAKREVFIGEADEEAASLDAVRQKFFDMLEEGRAVFLMLSQYESYFQQHASQLEIVERAKAFKEGRKIEGKVKLPRNSEVRGIIRNWERAVEDLWDRRFTNLRFEFKKFSEAVFMQPYPQARDMLEALLVVITKWYGVCAGDLATLLDLEPPAEAKAAGATFKKEIMYTKVKQQAVNVYKALDVKKFPAWAPFDLYEEEQGTLVGEDGLTYESFVAKFRVSLPEKGWKFDFERTHPTTRLKMRPGSREDSAAKGATIVMEIRDYSMAQSMDDLAERTQVATQMRFPAYKEIAIKRIKAIDPTMPGGKRPGLVKEFYTTSGEGGDVFYVRQYELFCRWYKRTYGLLCICKKGEEKDFEEAFKKASKSLFVLDAPEYQNFRDEEKARMKKTDEEGGMLLPPDEDK